jgi:hypothetical protein
MRGGVWNPAQVPPPDGKIYHAVRTGASFLGAVASYYDFDLNEFFASADPNLPEFDEAAMRVLWKRLARTPDDPAAVFGRAGALADIAPRFQDARVATALLRALARRRLRLCLEAVQFGRIDTKIARVPAFDNLALGRPAWQSSVSMRSRKPDLRRDAEGGNDGDAEVEYGFHTAQQDGPWWAVDLGSDRRLRGVRIFNRRENEHKFRQFEIETSLDFVSWTTAYAHPVDDRKGLFLRPIEIAFNPVVIARYLRVRLARRGVLHLAEVEVIGD